MIAFSRKGFLVLVLSIVSAAGAGTEATLQERAQKGEASAQFQLGEKYAKGDGLGKDHAKAALWWRKAAEQGFTDAQFSLGISYVTGQGVPRDLVRAHVWLNIAGANGVEEARKKVSDIEAEMTTDQKAEAMKRASELFETLAKKDELPKVEPHAEQPTPRARREQNPLPGFEKVDGDNPNNFGSNIAKVAPKPEAVPEKIEGAKDAPLIQGATGSTFTVDHNRPPPRQQLNQRSVRPAIFSENQLGTKNIGMAPVDAKWSNYGVYLQRLIETVQIQWDSLISEGKNYPSPGSTVTVKFKINSDGAISRIVNVDGGMSGPTAEGYCVSAITKPSPYGKWTDDMIAMLGSDQEMTFVFYYQ